jgi:hypothetical protein
MALRTTASNGQYKYSRGIPKDEYLADFPIPKPVLQHFGSVSRVFRRVHGLCDYGAGVSLDSELHRELREAAAAAAPGRQRRHQQQQQQQQE